MHRIALHIGLRVLIWFLVALAVVVGLFVVSQLLRVAPLLAGAGVGLGELLLFGLETAIPVIGWAATPAFVVAVMLTFGQMDSEGETVALEAVGLGRGSRLAGPLILSHFVAVCVAGVALWAGPRLARSARGEALEFASRAIVERIRPGRVTALFDGVTIYVASRDEHAMKGLWIDDRRFAGGRQVGAETARVQMADGRLGLFLQRGAVIIPAEADGGPAALAFETLSLAWDVRALLEKELSFLPEDLTAPTARLLGPPPRGVSAADWGFAFWRRVGQVVGFLILCLFALDLATQPLSSNRALNVGAVAAGFAGFHLAGRAAEAALLAGALGAKAAAFAPSGIVAAMLSLRGVVLIVKRLSMR